LSDRYTQYKFLKCDSDNVSKIKLDEASLSVLSIEAGLGGSNRSQIFHNPVQNKADNAYRNAANGVTIYLDGASRGNPGPSGLGYYIIDENGKEVKRGGEFIGFATSRVAEYYGLKEGLEQAIELGLKKVNFRSDNLMMVNQLNGVYPVKNKDLFQVHEDVLRLISKLDAFSIMHVPREQNRVADAEANRAMDEHARAA
jgi:ribonuclease HI